MFTTLAVAARDRKRLAEISGVAARFGLEAVLLRLGLGGGEAHADGPEPLSRRTRQALEALGPTFVKLGQILSTRSDLLPADWIAEFEQLQSAGPTLDFETLRPEVEAALGGPPEQVFARFDAARHFFKHDAESLRRVYNHCDWPRSESIRIANAAGRCVRSISRTSTVCATVMPACVAQGGGRHSSSNDRRRWKA